MRFFSLEAANAKCVRGCQVLYDALCNRPSINGAYPGRVDEE